jgi:hypothetical protein
MRDRFGPGCLPGRKFRAFAMHGQALMPRYYGFALENL